VVTGVGAITPLGHSVDQMWQGLQKGKSAVDLISLFDASSFPTKIAAEVRELDFEKEYRMGEKPKKASRNTHFALLAAQAAIKDAQLQVGKNVLAERCGVYLGSGEGSSDFNNFVQVIADASSEDGSVNKAYFIERGVQVFNAIKELEQEPNVSSMHIASALGAAGPNLNCLTACAASSQAIGEATQILRRRDVDVMITGGTHSMIHPFGMTGFNLLTALSTSHADCPSKASRPFDRKRDGFILGEGAGILVLEELEHALERGARIYGEIVGYGSTADAYRITDVHPEGRGASAAIELALRDAGLKPEEVHYINAHGTSTIVNDTVETKAIKQVFKEAAYRVPVSSIKSMMGHLIAAAGAVELITCLLVMRDGVIPPTINYENPDPDCNLDYVPNVARQAKVDVALSNSFGFGGQNITLIAKKFSP